MSRETFTTYEAATIGDETLRKSLDKLYQVFEGLIAANKAVVDYGFTSLPEQSENMESAETSLNYATCCVATEIARLRQDLHMNVDAQVSEYAES